MLCFRDQTQRQMCANEISETKDDVLQLRVLFSCRTREV